MSTVTSAPAERASLLTRPFLIVTATALVFFVYIGMLIPIVPLFVEGPLAAGEFGIGLTVAAFALAAICARPLIGRFADRYGRRVLMVGGAVMAGASGIAASQVTEFWQLLALRGVMGIGEAAVFVGAATLIADLSPRDRRAEGASYFSVAVFGGIGIGPIVGEALLGDDNFAQAFVDCRTVRIPGRRRRDVRPRPCGDRRARSTSTSHRPSRRRVVAGSSIPPRSCPASCSLPVSPRSPRSGRSCPTTPVRSGSPPRAGCSRCTRSCRSSCGSSGRRCRSGSVLVRP